MVSVSAVRWSHWGTRRDPPSRARAPPGTIDLRLRVTLACAVRLVNASMSGAGEETYPPRRTGSGAGDGDRTRDPTTAGRWVARNLPSRGYRCERTQRQPTREGAGQLARPV